MDIVEELNMLVENKNNIYASTYKKSIAEIESLRAVFSWRLIYEATT